jgi:hypothetical protein
MDRALLAEYHSHLPGLAGTSYQPSAVSNQLEHRDVVSEG